MTDFEATVARIMEQTKLTRDEVMARIRRKHRELEIVTLLGAALMVEAELGVE